MTAAPPVFLLTSPRSCSTVVTGMLGAHPEVVALPEMKLFRRPRVAGLLADWPHAPGVTEQGFRAGLVRGVAGLVLGDESEEGLAASLAWLRERGDWTGARLLAHLRTLAAPSLLVEKSPENSGRDLSLDRLLAVPDIRVVHLVRHPVSVVESFTRMWEPPAAWDLPQRRWQFAAALWLQHQQRVERRTAHLPASRVLRVRAEDVVNDQDRTLPGLCAWLGVSGDVEALTAMRHPERWRFASTGTRSARGGGDPHFLAAPALRTVEVPAGTDFPAKWGIDPWTQLACAALARRYGYGTEAAADYAA